MPLPIPRLAPVTTATLPESEAMPLPSSRSISSPSFCRLFLYFRRQFDFRFRRGHHGAELIGHFAIDLHDRTFLIVDQLADHLGVHERDIAGKGGAAIGAVGVHDLTPLAGPAGEIIDDPGAHRRAVAVAARHADMTRPARYRWPRDGPI